MSNSFKKLYLVNMVGGTMDRSIFRAYDIRGRVPDQINSEVMYNIGLYIGSKYKTVTTSFDIRTSSPSLAFAFSSGVLEGGGDVSFQGMTSFGVALYSGYKEKTKISTLVTASHLPPEYNGLKLYYSDGLPLSSDEISSIYKEDYGVFRTNWKNYGVLKHVDHTKDYVGFFSGFDFSGLKIGIDCGGGSVSLVADSLFGIMKFDTEMIFCKPNPSFSDRESEPKPENLTVLSNTIREKKLDFGVAFDGDGDRAVILDNAGKYVPPSHLAILFARDFLASNGKATVVVNMECSKVVEDVLEQEGAKVMRIPVGHTHLIHYVRDLKADIGVEASGHMIIPEVLPFDDGVVIPVKLAQILKDEKTSLSELLSGIPTYPMRKQEIELESDEKKFEIMGKFKEFAVEEYQDVNTLDGVRISFDDGWVLVRASNTSPKMRITVEAETEERVNQIMKEFVELVRGFM